jgi:hypothetical protein
MGVACGPWCRFGEVESTRLRSVPINTEDDKGTRRSKSILREYSDDAAVVNGYVVFGTKEGNAPPLRRTLMSHERVDQVDSHGRWKGPCL